MFKRILVPMDGTPTADRGLDQAIKLARSQGATLCLLHVVDERGFIEHFDVGASLAITETLLASLRDRGRKIIDNARAKAAKQGVKARPVLVENIARRVADLIVDNARKCRADLIVMGTHGRRGITRLVMGSDAEGVLRAALVPVLLVR
jgi:nucleotide-binding universal stress UspA family protein